MVRCPCAAGAARTLLTAAVGRCWSVWPSAVCSGTALLPSGAPPIDSLGSSQARRLSYMSAHCVGHTRTARTRRCLRRYSAHRGSGAPLLCDQTRENRPTNGWYGAQTVRAVRTITSGRHSGCALGMRAGTHSRKNITGAVPLFPSRRPCRARALCNRGHARRCHTRKIPQTQLFTITKINSNS